MTDLPRLLHRADGLIHATPTGRVGHPGIALDPDLLHDGLWVADVVYRVTTMTNVIDGGTVDTDYDAELIHYSAALRRAWAIRPGDRVLDIGCGAGQTTRLAAGAGASAVGNDVAAVAIARSVAKLWQPPR